MAEVLECGARRLAGQGIDEPRLDAEALLRHLLTLDRAGLYVSLREQVSPEQVELFSSLLQRRLDHEPIAYIVGHKEFFGLDFEVTPSVLIPRPETELLVEAAVELGRSRFPKSCLIGDIGTGCGAIAVALAVNLPHARVFATDLSASALEVAERNCRRHQVGAQVTLLHGDLLDPLPEIVHLIVANLPYVSESEVALLAPEITRYEPRAAYMGGRGGLEAIELLLERASRLLLNGGAVLLEIGHDQAQALAAGARKRFPGSRIDVLKDLSGLDRVLVIL